MCLSRVPDTTSAPIVPVGARLAPFLPRWLALFPQESWAITVVQEGVRMTFQTHPPLTNTPQWIRLPQDPDKRLALRNEVQALLQKQAIEPVIHPDTPGFYSHLFVVPKPGGRWRPVIDLSRLNRMLVIPRFKMETARALRRSVNQGDYAVSIDLTDAYLHVPMHRSTRRYLRFAIDGQVFTFRALPFGISIAPWVFTRLMDVAVGHLRQVTVSDVSNYLDDCLQKNKDPLQLAADLTVFLDMLESLGWLVNRLKSSLVPTQSFCHLGMRFATVQYLVFPTEKRILKLLDLGQSLLRQTSSTPRLLHQFLGVCVAMAELVPLGGVNLRPLQWAIADVWTQQLGDWDRSLPLTPTLRASIGVWLNREWIDSGVPIRPAPPSISLCTDASGMGWGAHLLPAFHLTHGLWSAAEQHLHSNDKELLAVHRALQAWSLPLSRQSVMVLSDNQAVCAYINHQGGTHSRSLCQRTIKLLNFCRVHGISLQARHIPGRLNVIADGLSRNRCLHTEWTLHPEVFLAVQNLYPTMEIDLFATRYNARLPQFVSPFPDDQALAVDGLAFNLSGRDLYAFPPTPLVPLLLARMDDQQCLITLIAPLQWKRPWVSSLLRRCLRPPVRLPLRPDLLRQPFMVSLHPRLESLNLHVFRLSSYVSHDRGFQHLLSTGFATLGEHPL